MKSPIDSEVRKWYLYTLGHEERCLFDERVGIKMDSGINEESAEMQAFKEMRDARSLR